MKPAKAEILVQNKEKGRARVQKLRDQAGVARLSKEVTMCKRTISKQSRTIQNLEEEVARLNKIIDFLTMTPKQVTALSLDPQDCTGLQILMIHTAQHQAVISSPNPGQAIRYHPILKKLYVLMAFIGKSYYELLHRYFCFPSWSSIKLYRKELQQTLGIANLYQTGDYRDTVNTIMKTYFPHEEQKTLILAYDATYLLPELYRTQTKIGGLVIDIEPSTATIPELLYENLQSLIKAVFALQVHPIGKRPRCIPILLLPDTKGNVTAPVIDEVDSVMEFLTEIGYNIVGEAFDGDVGHLYRCDECYHCVMHLSPTCSDTLLTELFEPVELTFFDPLHMLKNDRGYKLRATQHDVFFGKAVDVRRILKEVLQVRDWVLDTSPIKSMQDELALQLFTAANIHKAWGAGETVVFISLLPSTLLASAIFDANHRFILLALGFAFMYIYLSIYVNQRERKASRRAQARETRPRSSRINRA